LRRSIFDHVTDPRHAGLVEGADRRGEAAGEGASKVSIGIWYDRMGRVQQARWTATGRDADALAAYAEMACALLESGVAPSTVDAGALRRSLEGVRAPDQHQANYVAEAISAALGRVI
jgi:hypothetical protein